MMRLVLNSLCLICALVLGSALVAQTPIRGQEGRVIILDVSGSMNRGGFRSGPSKRWDNALVGLEEILDQLQGRGDTVPTALVTFGNRYKWADVSSKYKSSYHYPASGRLCSDVTVQTEFNPLDRASSRQVLEVAKGQKPSGLTPLPLALNLALELLDPKHGGEIIVVSDMEKSNCLHKGQSLCGAIEQELRKFREGKKLTVYFRVLATPNAGFADAIEDCGRSTTEPIDEDDPDHEGAVERLLGTVPVDVLLTAGGAGNFDPNGIDPAGFIVTAIDKATGKSVSSGPPGVLNVPPGAYTFQASHGGKTWEKDATVNSRGTVQVQVDGGQISIRALDARNAPIARLQKIEILDQAGRSVWSTSNFGLPERLNLGSGLYRIVGTIPGQPSVEVKVPLKPAELSDAVLRFDGQSQANEVAIDLTIHQPTLMPANRSEYAPRVTLITPDGSRTVLSPGVTSVPLNPGTHEIIVDATRPHRLVTDIRRSNDLQHLDILVTPGWFSARMVNYEGKFELLSSSDDPLFSFDDRLVEHSLPDGTYKLVVRRANGSSSAPQTFEIVTGELVELQF